MRFTREHPGWTAILVILAVVMMVLTIDQYSYSSPSIPFVGQRILVKRYWDTWEDGVVLEISPDKTVWKWIRSIDIKSVERSFGEKYPKDKAEFMERYSRWETKETEWKRLEEK